MRIDVHEACVKRSLVRFASSLMPKAADGIGRDVRMMGLTDHTSRQRRLAEHARCRLLTLVERHQRYISQGESLIIDEKSMTYPLAGPAHVWRPPHCVFAVKAFFRISRQGVVATVDQTTVCQLLRVPYTSSR